MVEREADGPRAFFRSLSLASALAMQSARSSCEFLPMTEAACLDPARLDQLATSFRRWIDESPRRDVRLARRRVFLIFQLIRQTGAKLHEILALDPFRDIDLAGRKVHFSDQASGGRSISLNEPLTQEIAEALADAEFRQLLSNGFAVDPAFVRRKFYEQADACGLARKLCGPEMIRRARAVELIQDNMPLPAVQKLLGHSNPSLTSAYLPFSEEELRRVTDFYLERARRRTTSARNAFFGKIQTIDCGDIQALVRFATSGGHLLTAMITNDSLERLRLRPGGLVQAEVKAPWVVLERSGIEPASSAENRLLGEVIKLTAGRVSSEYVVRLEDGVELCAIVAIAGGKSFAPVIGESVWVLFNCFAVILHAEEWQGVPMEGAAS